MTISTLTIKAAIEIGEAVNPDISWSSVSADFCDETEEKQLILILQTILTGLQYGNWPTEKVEN